LPKPAEMIVGPAKAFFMDEISNGLDSSTTFQIIKCFQQLAKINECTMLISLLQPTPEVFDLFDDLILMAEGKIIYHGPRNEAHNFFEGCGFRCPERKGMADFLQEVLSRKDQRQYWYGTDESYRYISSHQLSSMFRRYQKQRKLEEPSVPQRSTSGKKSLSFNKYSLPKLELFKACGAREALLIKRSMSVYAFKTVQVILIIKIISTKCNSRSLFVKVHEYKLILLIYAALHYCNHYNVCILSKSYDNRFNTCSLLHGSIILFHLHHYSKWHTRDKHANC
jgi:hypothetical protein